MEEKKRGQKAAKPQKKQDSRGKLRFFTVLFSLVAVAVAAAFYFKYPIYSVGLSASKFLVQKGATPDDILKEMKKAGLDAEPDLLKLPIFVSRLDRRLNEGWYALEPGDTLHSLTERLRSGKTILSSFRIPDGVRVWQVRDLLRNISDVRHDLVPLETKTGESGFKPSQGFKDSVSAFLDDTGGRSRGVPFEFPLEGLLAPDTYFYNGGVSDLTIASLALRHQKEILMEEWAARDASVDKTLRTPYEALILASVIEKESGIKSDRGMISSVFHNRLRIGMPLQADPTVIYGIGEKFDGNLTRAHLRKDSLYNTYIRKGLPPTPIASPSRLSIHAALNPTHSKNLYFVARGDGTTQFSEKLTDHNKAVKKYQKGSPTAQARRSSAPKAAQGEATKEKDGPVQGRQEKTQ